MILFIRYVPILLSMIGKFRSLSLVPTWVRVHSGHAFRRCHWAYAAKVARNSFHPHGT